MLDRVIDRWGAEIPSISPKLTFINWGYILTSPDQNHLVSSIFCREDKAASTLFRRIGKCVSYFVIIFVKDSTLALYFDI